MLQFPCLPVYQKEFCFIYTQKTPKTTQGIQKITKGMSNL